MRVILSELLTTEYTISTPFNALLGRVPVQVYAILDRTVVLQIIGEDDRRVVRHDFITVEPDNLRARPTPTIDRLAKSKLKGRENSHKHEGNGAEAQNIFKESNYEDITSGSEYSTLEFLESVTKKESSGAS